MLACGIALAPDVLLLDEPTGALDAHSTELAELQIKEAATRYGIIMIVVSHSPEQIARLADTVLTISAPAAE
jgi:ABC-type sulfate/molybdate transport systems ATPase subunit